LSPEEDRTVSTEPRVTIYITNYNYGRFLRQAIESVLSQTWSDIELLIIDDGSTDESHELLREYEDREHIYVVFQRNKGLNATNNVAIKLATGKYIMRLDADDYLAPEAVETMARVLEAHEDVALVFPDYYHVDEAGEVLERVQRHDFDSDVTLLDQPAHGACTMFRRDILLSVNGYDEDFRCQDGYDIWLKVTAQYNVKNVNEPLFYYRQHGKNLTGNEEFLFQTRASIMSKHVKRRGLEALDVLTVIPVRGGKADPRSMPLQPLGDKLLIDWTIDSVLHAHHHMSVVVTTPDERVLEHVRERYGDRVIAHWRDPHLARINTSLEATLSDVLEGYEAEHSRPDALLMLFIESPFRHAFYIDQAVFTRQIYEVEADDAVRADAGKFYLHRGNGIEPPRDEQGLRLESADLYRRVGSRRRRRREHR